MKERLDVLLVKRNLAASREKAKAIIMSGNVYVDNQKEDKPGTTFPEESKIEVRGHTLPYVSRGGLKLEKAMKEFQVSVEGKVCTDVGSSTGGFTDCMLQNGAEKVFAVDVGNNQLADKLRMDNRVISMENTDIREANIPLADFIGCDVSFISLTKIFESVYNILKDTGSGVFLIKPQFEAGKQALNKKGIVKDRKDHVRVITELLGCFRAEGLAAEKITISPVKGGDGNLEYLILLKNADMTADKLGQLNIKEFVNEAFDSFKD